MTAPHDDPYRLDSMAATLEREIKLRFDDAQQARGAILAAGATPLRPRRLQHDRLFDTPGGLLRGKGSILRVRTEAGAALVTFKGPVQPSTAKLREEIETSVGDGPTLLKMLEAMGFAAWFRYEKFREEFAWGDVVVALDETPVGTFVEIEGTDAGIAAMAAALGRGPGDYVLDSYRGLYVSHCEARGLQPADMLFSSR